MDGDDRRTSQYAQAYHHTGSRPPTSQPMGLPGTERFAQPGTPVRGDSTRHSMTRPYLPSYAGYGYPEQQYTGASIQDGSPMQGVEMQYSPAGYVQNLQRQSTQQQQFAAQYPHQGSILPTAPQQTMYDPMSTPYQQQQSRQSAALEVMTSQLGGLPPYMQQTPDPSAGSSSLQQQLQQQQQQQQTHTPQQSYTSQPDHHHFPSRTTIPSQHPQTQPHHHQPTPSTSSPYHHPASTSSQTQTQTQTSHHQNPPTAPRPTTTTTTTAAQLQALLSQLTTFHASLSSALTLILANRLPAAADTLLGVTRWLVANVQALGMHHDDESRYEERLALWGRLNVAWEALAGRWREGLVVGGGGAGRERGRGLGIRGVGGAIRGAGGNEGTTGREGDGDGDGDGEEEEGLSVEAVTSLVEELVGLADQLEGLGLVDYQMGFAEEQIVAGFLAGLEVVADREGDGEAEMEGGGRPGQQHQQQHQQQGMGGHGQQMAMAGSRG